MTQFAKRFVLLAFALLAVAALGLNAQSLGYEGPTGVFVTPIAAVAASPANNVGKPAISYHFLDVGPVGGVHSTFSVTEGFAKRFEVGYTSVLHSTGNTAVYSPLWDYDYGIVHGKVNVIAENAGKNPWVPAISVGAIYRFNDQFNQNLTNTLTAILFPIPNVVPPTDKTSNADFYVVGTKVITQISKKVPILISGGVRGTNSVLWGLGGAAPNYEARGFGTFALVFTLPNKGAVIPAVEVSQQPNHIETALNTSLKLFDVPTSEVYAVRIVPTPKAKLNIDFGILHGGGFIGNALTESVLGANTDLKLRHNFAFALSYGF